MDKRNILYLLFLPFSTEKNKTAKKEPMFPIMYLTQGCCGSLLPPHENKQLTTGGKIFAGAILFDIITSLTALIVGILGAISLIQGMPLIVSCTLVFLSLSTLTLWITAIVDTRSQILSFARSLLL